MRIGIIGCQSKHAEWFGALFNRENIAPGCRVEAICPVDEPARLPYVLSLTDIPAVENDPAALIARSDAVLVTTRLADTHPALAGACIDAGRPVFVDKPFAPDAAAARALLARAREKGVPLVAGSTFCFLPELDALRAPLERSSSVSFRYRADPDSPFGGYRFYGSHLTDLCSLFFSGALAVSSKRAGDSVCSTVRYADRLVTLESGPRLDSPCIVYEQEGKLRVAAPDDAPCYRAGMQAFLAAVQSGRGMENTDRLAASSGLLAAIVRSLESGREEPVER
ncbi:MAG: Gfo/Idh/MocA family oxidoreductase [Oscillospiraceae bacterium]|nr:Gfo/Idh/MocA family oxidoreductase [Oscillospiraceae bacterium]